MSNPHRNARRLIRAHRRAERGAVANALQAVVPLVAGLLVAPLFRPVFLHFLDGHDPGGEGLFGVLIRVSLVVISLLAIDTYGVLIRSPDRSTLAILPVEPGEVAVEELADVARARAWVILVAAILLAPIGLEVGIGVWLGSVGVVFGAFAAGLTVSAATHLLAVGAADNPRLAGLLDLLRGSNPREQAAFLWAPGLALAVASLPVALAIEGVRRFSQGEPLALVALVLPLAMAAFAFSRVPGLAQRGWFQASAVLADIDARYAMVEEAEEATAAYLDWMPRFLPDRVALYALKDLRQGWRARRSWISGAWGVGLLAAMASWSADAASPGRALAIGVLGIWLMGVVGVLMERDEPDFLRAWLPSGGSARSLARGVVLCAWLQPAVWLPVVVLSIRHGLGQALTGLLLGQCAVFGAALLAVLCMRLRDRGVLAYGPIAAVAGSALALVATRGGP